MVCAEAPVAHELTDSELFCRYRDLDDQDAFSALYVRYSETVFNVLRHDFRFSSDVADDVAQQVWMCVVTSREQFATDTSFKNWISRISRNRAIDYKRLVRSHDDIDDVIEPADSRVKPVDHQLLIDEDTIDVDRLVATLPPDMTLAIRLLSVGESLRSAAQKAGVHLTALCRTLAEAKALLLFSYF
jgi:RNA polymerase sigma factor (sigma-70 family)